MEPMFYLTAYPNHLNLDALLDGAQGSPHPLHGQYPAFLRRKRTVASIVVTQTELDSMLDWVKVLLNGATAPFNIERVLWRETIEKSTSAFPSVWHTIDRFEVGVFQDSDGSCRLEFTPTEEEYSAVASVSGEALIMKPYSPPRLSERVKQGTRLVFKDLADAKTALLRLFNEPAQEGSDLNATQSVEMQQKKDRDEIAEWLESIEERLFSAQNRPAYYATMSIEPCIEWLANKYGDGAPPALVEELNAINAACRAFEQSVDRFCKVKDGMYEYASNPEVPSDFAKYFGESA